MFILRSIDFENNNLLFSFSNENKRSLYLHSTNWIVFNKLKKKKKKGLFVLGLSKHIRWPDPLGDSTRTDSKPTDPTYSGDRQWIFSTRNRLRQVGFGFSPQKTQKPELTGEKPIIRRKPRFRQENSRFRR